MKNAVDKLQDLFNVRTDAALAAILGQSRQSLGAARKKGRLSRNIIRTAALKLKIDEAEMYRRLYGDQKEDIGTVLIRQLSAHVNRLAIELGKMREENSRLDKENCSLRAALRQIDPEIERSIPRLDKKTLFERLSTEDMAYVIESVGQLASFAACNAFFANARARDYTGLKEQTERQEEALAAMTKASRCIEEEMLKAAILPEPKAQGERPDGAGSDAVS